MISYEQKYLLNCILTKIYSKELDLRPIQLDHYVKYPVEKYYSNSSAFGQYFYHIILKQQICTFELSFKELDFVFEITIKKDKNLLFIKNLLEQIPQKAFRDLLCICKSSIESLYQNESDFCKSFYLKTIGFELELDNDHKIKDLYSEKIIENSLNVKFDKTVKNKNVFVKTLVGI